MLSKDSARSAAKNMPLSKNDAIQHERVQPWFADKGDETLRLTYPLNEHSVVFDVGGYKGEFARDIFCKYGSTIYIFEPLKEFFDICTDRFSNNKKVHAFNFGLAHKSFDVDIHVADNASSIFAVDGEKTKIRLESIVDFINTHRIGAVDLIKINIEGGEYDLLDSLIDNNLIRTFKNIQVQFHDFVIENPRARMERIQKELSKTHRTTYQYEFVWENWKIKDEA